LLSQHGVPFEAYNVEKTPEAWRDLQRFHIATVPAVIVGDRAVHGWNPRGLAELFGWPSTEDERLAPHELLARLDLVLDIARQALSQVPDEHLDIKPPDRDRPLRRLGPHIFRIAQAFLDATASRELTYEALVGEQEAPMQSTAEILAYADAVRERVRAWAANPPAEIWSATVETYYGPCSVADLLERTVWHCAQHVRQVHWLMERVGIEPRRPLGPEDLRGLPLPEALW
jgi:hypothetical protein